MNKIFFFIGVLCPVFLINCGNDEDPEADLSDNDDRIIQDFIEANELDATRDTSGVYIIPIVENPSGELPSQTGNNVLSIYYRLKVLDSANVETVQPNSGPPVRLKTGVNAVVPVGLDRVIGIMKIGETYRFIIPSELAYGDLSFSELIPENAIMDLEVSLIEAQDEADILTNDLSAINNYIVDNNLNDLDTNPTDSVILLPEGVFFKNISSGDDTRLAPGTSIDIEYVGSFLDNETFDQTLPNESFNYQFGTGQVIDGLDIGISQMGLGANALIIIPSQLAYSESVRVIPDFLRDELAGRDVIPTYAVRIGPYRPLVFEVTLQR